jgi:indole-3-glycerol phosphate synthase
MSDILTRIAAYKRLEVDDRKAAASQADMEARARLASPPRGFRRALQAAHAPGRLALIAEIKQKSPSRGMIRKDFEPAALARAYEAGGAACLSVLTDAPSFGGAEAYLTAARDAVALPCLRKDFLLDPWQVAESRALGADCILVILAMTDDVLNAELMAEARRFGMDVLVEAHDEAELDRAGALGADLVGVNNRDLRTFEVDLANTERLARRAPANALLVTESGIFTSADAARLERSGAKAMLVGESLMRQPDVAAATRTLLGVS